MGKLFSTWQYLKNTGAPAEVSTRDTIVSKHFYGKGELNADGVITDLENTKLAPLVDSLCDTVDFGQQAKDIAELISHLSIRSKLIRKGFENLSNRFLNEMKGMFGDRSTVDLILRATPDSFIQDQFDNLLANPPSELNDALKIFEHLGLSNDDVKSLVTGLIQSELQDPDSREKSVTQATDVFRQFFDPSPQTVSRSIKDGHIKALIANVVPESRVEIFRRFEWSVLKLDFNLILGDSPCLFRTEEHDYLVPSCEPRKALGVYLPLSMDQLLVGKLNSGAEENLSRQLNGAIAASYYEQFIASTSSDELLELIPLIGTNAGVASDGEVEGEIEEIRQNINNLIYGSSDVD